MPTEHVVVRLQPAHKRFLVHYRGFRRLNIDWFAALWMAAKITWLLDRLP
jgi:hypothetical protein